MPARLPDHEAHVEHDGVKIGYRIYGNGAPTFLLLPTWTIVHTRFWKMQIPYLARHHRVVTFDAPGNGESERSTDPSHYEPEFLAGAALDVLDTTGTERAILVSLSKGSVTSLYLAAAHPERVLAQAFIGPTLPLTPPPPERADIPRTFHLELDDPQGWHKYNAHHWRHHYDDFAEFFFGQCFPEPHSTKQREDAVGWAMETTPEVLLADAAADFPRRTTVQQWCATVDHPVLVVQGTDDRISPVSRGEALAAATGGDLVKLENAGHIPPARDPVKINHLLRELAATVQPPARVETTWTRGRTRQRRVLMISSPIGLGHAGRDLATMAALRRHHPDAEIEWLAQSPVTRMLADAGETVHPASAELVSESGHIESESGEHDLHCFQAWRRMDEILLANFHVFHDLVTSRDYDLVVADEAWDVDYFLHENPELKRFAYAWTTDFVGWLPMPEGGAREAMLTADYNAEMIGHIERRPRLRDLAMFVGNPDDIVPDRFGPDLPLIRDWTEAHYRFPGYVTGFDPAAPAERERLRADLGYRPDELVCVVTVGGSGVGGHLLRRVMDAFPAARRKVPPLRMIVVAGPRIDPGSLPAREGLEVHGYVSGLWRHLAACDLAVVQGGLTTCMELVANRTPFIYVPLRRHFEQQFHVHHRLGRYGGGVRVDFADADPDHLAALIAGTIGRPTAPRPVEAGGAERAAAMLAELL